MCWMIQGQKEFHKNDQGWQSAVESVTLLLGHDIN